MALTDDARPSAASVHEAQGRQGALPARLKPLDPAMRIWGPAYPVTVPLGNNLPLHWAVERAQPGDVLVVDAADGEFGYWGEVLACAAVRRGIAGLAIDGGVRDLAALQAGPLAVFASRVSIQGTGKDIDPAASLGDPITIGGVPVNLGDLVVGDADGLVIVPAARAADIIERAVRREADERSITKRIISGVSTTEIYGLATDPALPGGRA
jgi:4-hydroxy-4-methyl-2-oxoglutarate aldolase